MKEILIADKADILVADDQIEVLQYLTDLLSDQYHVHPFTRGASLLAYLEEGKPADLVMLDIVMPELDGYEVCQRLRAMPQMEETPIIFLTSLSDKADEERGLTAGAVDFMTKPFSPTIVLARVAHHVRLGRAMRVIMGMNEYLEERIAERTADLQQVNTQLLLRAEELARTQDATIHAFSILAEARDNELGQHIQRTQLYMRELSTAAQAHAKFALDLDDTIIEMLFRSAPLHDIGKVAIPDAILLKPGKLDTDEFSIMKSHVVHGRNAITHAEKILGTSDGFLRHAREIAYSHHEKWDGSGYPEGRAGTDIPLSARLMAIADVYDALISIRPYKARIEHEQAVAIISNGRGSHFDPDIVDIFMQIQHRFNEIAEHFSDAA